MRKATNLATVDRTRWGARSAAIFFAVCSLCGFVRADSDSFARTNTPHLVKNVEVVQGRAAEVRGKIGVMFISDGNVFDYPRARLSQLVMLPLVQASPDLTVEVLELSVEPANIKVPSSVPQSPGSAGEYIEQVRGVAITCRLRISASPAIASGERTVDIYLPHLANTAEANQTPGWKTDAPNFHFLVKIWPSEAALMANSAAVDHLAQQDTDPEETANAARMKTVEQAEQRSAEAWEAAGARRPYIYAIEGVALLVALVLFGVVTYRCQKRLGRVVIMRGDVLPPLCMCCGTPATHENRKKFYWRRDAFAGSPDYFERRPVGMVVWILIAIVRYFTERFPFELGVPLCNRHRRHWALRNDGVLIALFLLWPAFIVGCVMVVRLAMKGNNFVGLTIVGAVLAGALMWMLLPLTLIRTAIRVRGANDRGIVLFGVNRRFIRVYSRAKEASASTALSQMQVQSPEARLAMMHGIKGPPQPRS